jgi:hypothetical protein
MTLQCDCSLMHAIDSSIAGVLFCPVFVSLAFRGMGHDVAVMEASSRRLCRGSRAWRESCRSKRFHLFRLEGKALELYLDVCDGQDIRSRGRDVMLN